MKRLAIFVEGQTEKIFVRKLLEEIAGKSNIAIAEQDMQGKQNSRFTALTMSDPVTAQTKYYVLICNSGSDNSVVSDIRDQYVSLVSSGYSKIIGLRDVYPIPITGKGILERRLLTVLPRGSVASHIVLAVMEVEAWFLAEWKHFVKIDINITISLIQSSLGFNPKLDNMESRNHPAEDLHQVYQLVGKSYRKKENQVNRVVSNLDYEFLYLELAAIVPSLGKFISYIDDFMKL